MIKTQADPQTLQTGGNEAYHSPGEFDIFLSLLLLCSSFLCRFANFESLHLFFFLLFSEEEQDVYKKTEKFAFKKMANKEKERDRDRERKKKENSFSLKSLHVFYA